MGQVTQLLGRQRLLGRPSARRPGLQWRRRSAERRRSSLPCAAHPAESLVLAPRSRPRSPPRSCRSSRVSGPARSFAPYDVDATSRAATRCALLSPAIAALDREPLLALDRAVHRRAHARTQRGFDEALPARRPRDGSRPAPRLRVPDRPGSCSRRRGGSTRSDRILKKGIEPGGRTGGRYPVLHRVQPLLLPRRLRRGGALGRDRRADARRLARTSATSRCRSSVKSGIAGATRSGSSRRCAAPCRTRQPPARLEEQLPARASSQRDFAACSTTAVAAVP